MMTHAEKTNENNSRASANKTAQKAVSPFIDNRPEAATQRKLQGMADNSSQSKYMAQFQGMADRQSPLSIVQKKADQVPTQKGNRTGLPDNLKAGIENLSGYSMNDVKVHYNSDKPASLQAHAYAQGTDIHVAPGQERHLPHEAWHVVQQKQGRVKPTMQLKGKINVNDDAGLEKEADVMGVKALQMMSSLSTNDNNTTKQTEGISNTLQRVRSAAGDQYIQNVLTLGEWGGYVEANAIATGLGFKSYIYKANDENKLELLTEIGTGAEEPRSLFWTGNHYQVINGAGNLAGQDMPALAHDPQGDGNCMYEAIYYIVRKGSWRVVQDLFNTHLREIWVMRMRKVAAENIDDALANVLGEEMMQDGGSSEETSLDVMGSKKSIKVSEATGKIYNRFPPEEYYAKFSKNLDFYHRSDNVKSKEFNIYLKEFKDKKEREEIIKHLIIDRRYSPIRKKTGEEDTTPFISIDDDVKAGRYIVKRTKSLKIRQSKGESGFEKYSGGKSVREAVAEAITGLDITGSITFKHSRHDFQPSGSGSINLQIQLGGAKDYRRSQGDTSSTLVVISSSIFIASERFKKIIQEAHNLSFNNSEKIEILQKK